jgi:hypothetical protein
VLELVAADAAGLRRARADRQAHILRFRGIGVLHFGLAIRRAQVDCKSESN